MKVIMKTQKNLLCFLLSIDYLYANKIYDFFHCRQF
jgi:hypothetical protein